MEDNFNTGMPDASDTSSTDTSYSTTTDYSTGYSAYSPEPEQKATLSIVSLVLGIVGLVFSCCCCLGVPFDIAAIVVGIIAKKKNVPKQGMALAGIILGAVALVIYVITVIINLVSGSGEAFSNSFMEGFQEGLNSGAVMFF
ncbi:MAG: DUF4190 domain-containing protein [Ruminococcus sp.]|nr:DUF4190 domain-containing protein [Ruminococcus sp.]